MPGQLKARYLCGRHKAETHLTSVQPVFAPLCGTNSLTCGIVLRVCGTVKAKLSTSHPPGYVANNWLPVSFFVRCGRFPDRTTLSFWLPCCQTQPSFSIFVLYWLGAMESSAMVITNPDNESSCVGNIIYNN